MRSIVAIIAIFILALGAAFAQDQAGNESKDLKKKFFYEWTDSKGTVHIADGLGKVPEQYRDAARKIEPPKDREAPGADYHPYPESSGGAETGQADAAAKAEWQQRIKDWEKRLSDAEKRHQELDTEHKELFRAWGSPAMAPVETKLKAEQIEQQMKEVQGEIDTAKNMIDNVIPEEARKAGVPPGWLRE